MQIVRSLRCRPYHPLPCNLTLHKLPCIVAVCYGFMLKSGAALSTVVFLPGSFTCNSMYQFTRAVVALNATPKDTNFIFDFSKLSFIDGAGLTVLCNTLEFLGRLGVTVFFDNYDDTSKDAIVYLDDCGFFAKYIGENLRAEARVRNTTLPFQPIQHAHAHGWLEHTFTPWMSAVLKVNHGALGSIRASLKEVFNNIVDHSTQEIGFVHVQHYPARSDVRVTVSDFGKGIPANVRKSYPKLPDGAAILRATQRGFTTKSRKTNMGVGLDVLVDCAVGNEGNVNIFSFQGTLRCRANPGGGSIRQAATIGFGTFPGTLVELILRTDRFIGDDTEEVDVTW